MDREKVIKGLEHCIGGKGCYGCPYTDRDNCTPFCQSNLMRDMMKCLIATERVKTKHNNGVTHWYTTAECDVSINPGDEYCPKCGRKLVWE